MDKTNTVSRLDWIDVAKGYGILLVIWAHLPNEGLQEWIYSFHMPLFFFLSGYVFSTKYPFTIFVKRKIKSMVIPYFCLGVPMLIFDGLHNCLKGEFSWENSAYFLESLLLQRRFQTLWYIACLFWLNLFFYALIKLVRYEWLLGIMSVVCAAAGLYYYNMGGAALFWNIDACLTAMPFFFFGYCYKMHHEKAAGLFSRKWLMILSFFLFGAINIYCYQKTWEISGSGLEMFFSEYGSPIYTYISAFAGIVSVILLSHLWVIKPLRYIGENSMLYYAWHQLIMMPIVEAFLENLGYSSWGNQRYTVIYKIVSVTIIVIITTICNEIIKRSRMAFILGK